MLHLDVIFAPTKCHLVWEGEISSLFDDGEVFPEDFFIIIITVSFHNTNLLLVKVKA